MPITRVRTGCLTCRRRKKKCDEKKDICGGCRRNSFACEWSQSKSAKRKATRRASTCTTEDAQESQSPKSYNTENDIASTSQSSDQLDNSTIPSDHGVGDDGEPLSTLSLPEVNLLLDSTDGVHAALAEPVEDGEEESVIQETIVTDMIVTPACATEDLTWESYGHRSIPYNIPLLPRLEPTSTSLLSHYLSRTANSMGNGSTDSNPFIVQLIPLAFSSELLLYLLLTQSAEHLAISEQDMPKSTLRMYYGRSIQLFREGLNNYLAGKEDDALILTIGTLVMCLTEVCNICCSVLTISSC